MAAKWAPMGRANSKENGSIMIPAMKYFSDIGSPNARNVMGITNKAPTNAMHRVSDINAHAVLLAVGLSCLLDFGIGAVISKC